MKRKTKKLIALMLVIFDSLIILFTETMTFAAYAEEAIVIGVAPGEKENVYADIFRNATDEDYRLLENVVYRESVRAACDEHCDRAVVETVLNRVLDPNYPNTISGVITDSRWGKQFDYRSFIADYDYQYEQVCDAISYVYENGATELPDTSYIFFATKKQSCATDHVWKGLRNSDGSRKYRHGMWFGRSK